ncbi:non-specific lipid transfer protein GPI-anchored 9-like [Spinacia oleracea]|uniref:Non-specific lipid transfer protein GPI-anchored 9-like n=1 Tax=Spinacia oleracea TaxID=3562 RepID=A0A9R0IXA6_SPIOL|nr:non-specific lipid transfer protein GPI-anchored 9-like [Spinacia oleracea]
MSKVVYLAFLVAVLVVSTPALAQDDGIPVPECVTELHPCGPFINSTTAEPPFECCQPLGTVIQNDLSCLCSVFSNVELIQSLSVNVSEAITLPERCSIPFDLVAQCQALMAQPEAPTMSPAEAPISGLSSGIALKGKGKKKSGASNIAWTGSAALGSFLLFATLMFY